MANVKEYDQWKKEDFDVVYKKFKADNIKSFLSKLHNQHGETASSHELIIFCLQHFSDIVGFVA